MKTLVGFAVGFIAGWAARSTVESSRAAAVGVASTAADLLERLKRAAAIESDYLEDFVAEVRSHVQEGRAWNAWNETPANGTQGGVAGAANGGAAVP